MTKEIIIAFGQGTNNIVQSARTNTECIYFPIENHDFGNTSPFSENDNIWTGMEIYKKQQKYLAKIIQDYDKIIIVAASFSSVGQGFIYSFSKYLKRRNKKLIFIINGNHLNLFYLSELKKCGIVTDVYKNEEYQKFYNKYYPKASILEFNGLINTIYIEEIRKHTLCKNKEKQKL